MIKTTHFFLYALILSVLFSCGGSRNEESKVQTKETPKALQDSKLDIESYSRYDSDLMEELYQELVDKTPALKKLEDDLETFSDKPHEVVEKFNKYDRKSSSYYGSINYKATSISDSLLRKKIIALISNSKDQYSGKTAELNSLLKLISENGSTLNDHHLVLKIALTLPVIEKYQSEDLPDKQKFKELIKQQEKLIERIDSATPGTFK